MNQECVRCVEVGCLRRVVAVSRSWWQAVRVAVHTVHSHAHDSHRHKKEAEWNDSGVVMCAFAVVCSDMEGRYGVDR